MEDVRLIANPHLLATDKTMIVKNTISYFDNLKDLLRKEYHDIYLSDTTIRKIKNLIDNEITNILNDRIIQECLDACIDEVIHQNKFDFCIPFD